MWTNMVEMLVQKAPKHSFVNPLIVSLSHNAKHATQLLLWSLKCIPLNDVSPPRAWIMIVCGFKGGDELIHKPFISRMINELEILQTRISTQIYDPYGYPELFKGFPI